MPYPTDNPFDGRGTARAQMPAERGAAPCWWAAYQAGGVRVLGAYSSLVVAMRVARQGRPWFEAERLGAKVEAVNAR